MKLCLHLTENSFHFDEIAKIGTISLMKIIFESGYDFNWQDDNENTAFHHAALGYENLEMLLKFVKNSERLGIGNVQL